MNFGKALDAHETSIPGLVMFDIPVHGDNRGWFKENWQREKMIGIGLPDFGPVQNNISFNEHRGTTRGIHAEPWDKFISVATGSVFGAWVDLRDGDSFGEVFTAVLDVSKAIFVPRGVANSFQTLEDDTVYTYLVNDHWSADAQSLYTFLNLKDPTVAIPWPIPLSEAEISEKDQHHPLLAEVRPMRPKRTLVIGRSGQLGSELERIATEESLVSWDFVGRDILDLADPSTFSNIDWHQYQTVINAAAFTQVDEAETDLGRQRAWAANASGVQLLAERCTQHSLTLVHISTDYVFDGLFSPHVETEPVSPLGVYGQSKAAGELAARMCPRHYVIRTSWVIGPGKNFIEIMRNLALQGVSPSVVSDQIGRLTFTVDLAKCIIHLLETSAEFGIYNCSNSGAPTSWSEIAKSVFVAFGRSADDVHEVSTKQYFAEKSAAPRPLNSVFSLEKIEAAGFTPRPQDEVLRAYLARLTD